MNSKQSHAVLLSFTICLVRSFKLPLGTFAAYYLSNENLVYVVYQCGNVLSSQCFGIRGFSALVSQVKSS